jgi:predicted transglutaminase-like cysteine proteinase
MKLLGPTFFAAVTGGVTAIAMTAQVDLSQADSSPQTLDGLLNTAMAQQEPVLSLDNGNFLSFNHVQHPIAGDAFTDYCERFEGNCDVQTEEYGMVNDPHLMLAIDEVNTRANSDIVPANDEDIYGTTEFWTEAVVMDDTRPHARVGDCEDYVLFKMAELQKIGVPIDAMSIVIVDPNDGVGDVLHAVLAVRTGDGDKILDNLTDRILHMHETGYTPIQATTFFNHGQWQGVSLTPIGTEASMGAIYETYQPEENAPSLDAEPQKYVPMPAPFPSWRK